MDYYIFAIEKKTFTIHYLSHLVGRLHLVVRMGLAIHCFLTVLENHADLEVLYLLAVQMVLLDQLDREDLGYQVVLDFLGNLLVLGFQLSQ